MPSPKQSPKKQLPGASPKTGAPKDGKLFNEWLTSQDQAELDDMINHLTLMIADARNAWVLPYLMKQLEAFELLRATPLQKM